MKAFRKTCCLLLFASLFAGGCCLQERYEDLLDCFLISGDIGVGACVHVQVGPLATGVGAWQGTQYGFFSYARDEARETWYVGLLLVEMEHFKHTHSAYSHGGVGFEVSALVTFNYPIVVGLGPNVVDMFWLSMTCRLFGGFRIGFNLAQFLDLILGFFGVDICGDDLPRQSKKAE